MLDISVLPAFIAVILVFLVPPGPDMTYMVAVGLQGGRSAAIRAILGIATGMSIYAVAVAIGLGTLVATHPATITIVQCLGAAYLLWLALTTFRHASTPSADPDEIGLHRWYLRGLTVSVTNPKIILFFLAVLPRFVGHAHNTTAQLTMLGGVNVATEVILYGSIGIFASTFRNRFTHQGTQTKLNYLAATVYLILALIIGAEAILG